LEERASDQYQNGKGRRDDRYTKDDHPESYGNDMELLKQFPSPPVTRPVAVKALALRAKHFPVRIPQKDVAARQRRGDAAKRAANHWSVTKKFITKQEYQKWIDAVNRTDKSIQLSPEALLGKNKLQWMRFAQGVYKVKYNGQFTSTGTIVCDKCIVPLHSHKEGVSVSIENPSATAKLADVFPVPDTDLGIFMASGVKSPNWTMRAPKNEQVMQLGFTRPDQIEPELAIGFCSAEGVYDAATSEGDCGGPVIAVSDGNLVGFHIAGGPLVNRFIPMTEKLAEMLRANRATLSALVFH